MTRVSIDQNCTPLWDVLPKLAALRARGLSAVHYVEDVDVAFTQQRAAPGTPPHVEPERAYPGGNSDWGATAFYSDFMGRNPVNPRTLEPFLRASIATFAKRAGFASLDELYETRASSDNRQIIAPSHSGDNRHRTLGDLSLREMRGPLLDLLEHARADTRRAFPLRECAARTNAFFTSEQRFIETFHESEPDAALADFYAAWVLRHAPGQEVGRCSALFENDPHELLQTFVCDYGTLAALYNQAIAETRPGIAPLNLEKGELPFFALWRANGKNYRTPVLWQGGGLATDGLVFPVSNGRLPLDEMRARGIAALPPKALLLVLHARMNGRALALPWQGSLYMPAARRLEELLKLPLGPVLRARFHFFDRMGTLGTPVQPPAWLAPFTGADALPACDFVARLRAAQHDARAELETAQTPRYDPAPELSREIEALQLARARFKTTAENAALWQRQKQLQQRHARALLDRVLALTHLLGLDYWDSRGAILPHALALGCEAFYRRVLGEAEIFEE